MPVKLLRTKWYIIDLDTRCVAVDYMYNRYWQAIETERGRNRMRRFTAMRGSHILEHSGRPWIIPLTLEEAEQARDEVKQGRGQLQREKREREGDDDG